MTTLEIATRLTALCKEGKYEQAQRELYSDDAKSIEPAQSPGLQTVEGLDNIIKKGDTFQSMIEEMHGGYVSEPLVGGNHISLAMGMDVSMKGMGRMKMDEVVVYEVKDGKIVKEQFFY
jgi:limonene-1,2-epoxide hydrolase